MIERFPQSIYAISHPEGLIKIGYATEPKNRFSSIQRSSSERLKGEFWFHVENLRLKDEAKIIINLERDIHKHLKGFRFIGEWFKITPDQAEVAIRFVSEKSGLTIKKVNFPPCPHIDHNTKTASGMQIRQLRAAKNLIGITYRQVSTEIDIKSCVIDRILNRPFAEGTVDLSDFNCVRGFFEKKGIKFIENGVIYEG